MLEGSSSLIEFFNFNFLIYYYYKITLIFKRVVEFTKCFKSYKNFKRSIMSFRSKIIKKMRFCNSNSIKLNKARIDSSPCKSSLSSANKLRTRARTPIILLSRARAPFLYMVILDILDLDSTRLHP